MTLTLGKTNTGLSVGLDIQQLLRSRLLVQASSGGGKSSLMRLIAEHTGNTQFFVLDPEGEFFTLREEVKGLLIVGQRGDLQADPKTAKVLARRLLEIGASAVIDLSDLQLPQRRQYVRHFIESLMSAPQSLQHDLLVFIDEAHMFVPERSAGEAESTAAVIDLMSRGRKRKFAGILATQRLSKLHKDAAAECANFFIGRTTLDVDQKRAIDMLGMTSQDRRVLRDLAVGEFFGFGPALDHPGVVQLRALLPSTKEPQRGANSTRIAPASSQVQRMITELTDLAKKDEDKPVTIEDAEATIAKLRRELAAKPKAAPVEKPVVDQKSIDRAVAARDKLWQGEIAKARKVFEALRAAVTNNHRTLGQALVIEWPNLAEVPALIEGTRIPAESARKSVESARISAPREVAKNLATPTGALSKPERRILTALAQRPEGLDLDRLAVLAGYTVNGHFNNILGAVRSKGYVTEARVTPIQILQEGLNELGEFEPLPTGEELQQYWLRKLSAPEGRILRVLLNHYPNPIEIEELASEAGYTVNGHFNNVVGSLRTKGLMSEARKPIVADASFFD